MKTKMVSEKKNAKQRVYRYRPIYKNIETAQQFIETYHIFILQFNQQCSLEKVIFAIVQFHNSRKHLSSKKPS